MTLLRSLWHWGGLYSLVFLSLGGIYWFETMPISKGAQGALSSCILIVMGVMINRWINRHEGDFLAFGFEDIQPDSTRWNHHHPKDRILEKR